MYNVATANYTVQELVQLDSKFRADDSSCELETFCLNGLYRPKFTFSYLIIIFLYSYLFSYLLEVSIL